MSIHTVTKKMTLVAAAAAALMTATACGTSTGNQANTSSQTNTTAAKSAFPVTLTDDANRKVTLTKQPMRIASATEGTDEILSALVPKKRIVMVTSYATDPTYSNVVSKLKGIPQLQGGNPNAEAIIAQKPDLVLMASYTSPGVVSQIEQAGIPSYEFNDFNSIADIEKNILVVGKLVGEEQKAKALDASMQSGLSAIHNAVKGQKPLTVLDYSSFGYAAGKDTTVNDVIVDAGGINAAAGLSGWQKITDEQVVKENPDVIIDTSDDGNFVQKILSDPALQNVSAVKHHRVYILPSAQLMAVSQYIVYGVSDLAHKLYPSVSLPNVSLSN